MKKKEAPKENVWRSLALVGSLSLNLGLMVAGGYFLGKMLEEHYQLANLKQIGLLVGLLLGFFELFRIAYKAGSGK